MNGWVNEIDYRQIGGVMTADPADLEPSLRLAPEFPVVSTFLSVQTVGFLFLMLLMVGCRSTGSRSAASVAAQEQIVRAHDGAEISRAELYEALADAQVIYLGEKHDVMRHHELQLEVLQALVEMGRQPTLGFEVFSLGQTGLLMDYARPAKTGTRGADMTGAVSQGAEPVERLRKRLKWGASRDESWSWYGSLLHFARQQQLPVFGADLLPSLRQRIGARGITGLTSVERRMLFPTDFVDPTYEALMHEQIKGAHCGWGPPAYLARMYETWIARNDAMSMAIAAGLDDRPDEPVVMILGAGHTLYDMGVYERVAHRRPGVRQLNLAFREASGEGPQSRRLRMVEVDETQHRPDHQYLWFTPGSNDSKEDPCAAFLRARPTLSGDSADGSSSDDEG
jgi:uncharacterized iron-regulated protein